MHMRNTISRPIITAGIAVAEDGNPNSSIQARVLRPLSVQDGKSDCILALMVETQGRGASLAASLMTEVLVDGYNRGECTDDQQVNRTIVRGQAAVIRAIERRTLGTDIRLNCAAVLLRNGVTYGHILGNSVLCLVRSRTVYQLSGDSDTRHVTEERQPYAIPPVRLERKDELLICNGLLFKTLGSFIHDSVRDHGDKHPQAVCDELIYASQQKWPREAVGAVILAIGD